ncbi:MAG: E2/UBC family protein [Candidatus Magasanikbacteria bacterium]|jgi:DUF1680 family protein
MLPDEDVAFLKKKKFNWSVEKCACCGPVLIIREYLLDEKKYDQEKTDLMIKIPAMYSNAALDMYYVRPHVKLRANGEFPQAANQIEKHLEADWQRFSRHVPAWTPGVDSLASFLALVSAELQKS